MMIRMGFYTSENPDTDADINSIIDDVFVLLMGNGWSAETIAAAMREKAEEVESKSNE